ncbi:hypothetical protein RE428_20600 [Marinobacter nanhaiticus D15-8W]|nr:hypothetical protein RE428_20600 [Marinobacter nanhaiticus D15-8W]
MASNKTRDSWMGYIRGMGISENEKIFGFVFEKGKNAVNLEHDSRQQHNNRQDNDDRV